MIRKLKAGIGILTAVLFLMFAIALLAPGPGGYLNPGYVKKIIGYLVMMALMVAFNTLVEDLDGR